jgi:uncharacterized iron-regulated membrane protein
MRTRPALLWHRWFGVLGGPWLFLIAATGSLLAFYPEIDRALNPDLLRAPVARAAAEPARIAPMMAEAEARWPGMDARYAVMPRAPDGTVRVRLFRRPDGPGVDGHPRDVYFDPASGAMLGSRVWGEVGLDARRLVPFLYEFHSTLHAGETMAWLLGVLALLWFADHLVSAPIALGTARRWPAAFRVRRSVGGHKRWFDLHRALSMWLLPVTATLAITGASFNLHDEFRAVLDRTSAPARTSADDHPVLDQPFRAPPVDADKALATARAESGGAAAYLVQYDLKRGLWTVPVHDPRDLDRHGARRIVVHARTGRVVEDSHWTQGTMGDAVLAWQFPLHSGQAFGLAGRVLVLLAGLATCSAVVTGYLIWWRKLSARRIHAARHGAAPSFGALQPAE